MGRRGEAEGAADFFERHLPGLHLSAGVFPFAFREESGRRAAVMMAKEAVELADAEAAAPGQLGNAEIGGKGWRDCHNFR